MMADYRAALRTIAQLPQDTNREKALAKAMAASVRTLRRVLPWVENEIKFWRTADMNPSSIMVSAGAYAADREYHGGYSE